MAPGRNVTGFHPHFSPWLADAQQLSRTLVAHDDIIRDFLARLRAVEQGAAANHMLLVGPRGIGKSHVLCLVDHYVAGSLQIPQEWTRPSPEGWVCVLFKEEEYAGQNSLANFLLTLFTKLGEALPREPLWKLPASLPQEADSAVVDCCFERLQRFHHDQNKRILLVIDNLRTILEPWPDGDHQRLRSFLSPNNLLVILGSAQSVFREVIDQAAAFHEFFEIRIMPELGTEQVLELLSRRFAEDGRQREFEARRAELSKKVSAIELLTGGNPRLILFLYQIATRSTFLDIEVALRSVLEDLREYFVRRFAEVGGDQARKVLDTMAQMAGPATPKEIAQAARLRLPLVNAQLKRLREAHYVRPIKLQRQKSTRYDITERLFRIWRQTATVAGRQRFRFLADFLKLYFTPEEIGALYAQHAQCLQPASEAPRDEIIRHVEELFYFQAAAEGEVRYRAFADRVAGLVRIGESGWALEEAQYLAAESLKQDARLGVRTAYSTQASIHVQTGRYSEALEDIRKLMEVGANEEAASAAEKLLAVNPSSAEAWRCLGLCVGSLGHYERALEAFRKAVEAGKPMAQLLTLQAEALGRLGRAQEALAVIDSSLALDPVVSGFRGKAWILAAMGRFEEALECVDRAREHGADPRAYHHDRGGLLLLEGRFADAWSELNAGLEAEPDDWALQVERLIALGCVGQQGPLMEAFPATLAQVKTPTHVLPNVCGFMHEVALNCLRRGEGQISQALFAASLGTTSWRSSEWFRKLAGNFLRSVLDIRPETFQSFVSLLVEKVKNEDVLKLLDPFLKASEFLKTKDLVILERVFPEVRELVLDIVRRVNPDLREELRRLI